MRVAVRLLCAGRDNTCANAARYFREGDRFVPSLCSLCDMLENGSRGRRAEPEDRALTYQVEQPNADGSITYHTGLTPLQMAMGVAGMLGTLRLEEY